MMSIVGAKHITSHVRSGLLLSLISLIGVSSFACRMNANNEEKLEALKNGYTYDEDSTGIATGAISVNAGDAATTSSQATLSLSSETAREMYLTNIAGCESGGAWETYAKSKTWTLTPNNGTATVYAKFRSSAGNISECMSDSITHDEQGPGISISAPSQSSVNAGTATYTITYTDEAQITLSTSDIALTKTGTAAATLAITGSGSSRTVTLSSISGKGTLKISIAAGTAKDSLGNPAGPAGPSATITVKEATSLVSGFGHFCVLLASDEVQCWGNQGNKALGNNSSTDSRNPVKVQGLEGVTISKLVGGGYHNCVLLSNGTVRCWGNDNYGILGQNTIGSHIGVATQVMNSSGTGPLSGVTVFSAGGIHNCALLDDQTVECWGYNASGQVGDNTTTNRYLPVKVKDSTGTANLTGVTDLIAGSIHVCAKLSTNDMRCWGANNYGVIGDNTTTNRKLPVQVKNSVGTGTLSSIDKMIATAGVQCVTHSDQTASCWGYNEFGNVGNNSTTAAKLPVTLPDSTGTAALSGISQIAGSPYAYTMGAIAGSQNQLYVWGDNKYGQLGTNSLSKPNHLPNPAIGVAGSGYLSGVSHYASTDDAACVILSSDKQVRCWGHLMQEAVGMSGGTTSISTPTAMKDSGGSQNLTGVTQAEMGEISACALINGGVQCWGINNSGSFGNNSDNSSHYPTAVSGLTSGISEISVGNTFGCAIKSSDSSLHCWGHNTYGQLGQNTTTLSKVPLQVKNTAGTGYLSGVTKVSVSSGTYHACAIADGVPYCWGLNTSMQSGNNSSSTNMKLPNPVKDAAGTGTLSGATAISTDNGLACAIVSDGVWCWGNNAAGKLGTNSSATSIGVASQVYGLTTGVTQISVGYSHACALKSDNSIWCWGENDFGRLGDGTTTDSSIPIQVQGLGGSPSAVQTILHSTCALVGTGVQCWGYNNVGNLGDSYTSVTYSATPVWISGATSGVSELYRGKNFCTKIDGLYKCWGSNVYGRLQQSTFQLTPALILPWAE